MNGGRYGNPPGKVSSSDVELAEIRTELRNQGADIAKMTGKIDTMTDAVTTMSVQMGHLVTKESCAEGRSALAEDLKDRMDSQREVTGTNLNVKDLLKAYKMKGDTPKGKLSPVPYPISKPPSGHAGSEKKERGAGFWVGLASGALALLIAFYSASTFIDRTIERQGRTEEVLIQIQQSLEKQNGTKQPAPETD